MVKLLKRIDLSIIVPAFNEEDGIGQTIRSIFEDAKRKGVKNLIKSFEVIVVDDGSFDETPKILGSLKGRYKNLKIITHKSNQGLGASIIKGVKHATKKFVTYLPSDGQVFLREITGGLKIAPYADLVLTYRRRRKDYNHYRQILSRTLMISMRIFFGLNFKDYNWVHIYKRDLFKHIKTKSHGVFYLGEVVVRTHKVGFKILEAAAEYHPRSTGYSKNARLQVVFATLRDLIKLWVELQMKPLLS